MSQHLLQALGFWPLRGSDLQWGHEASRPRFSPPERPATTPKQVSSSRSTSSPASEAGFGRDQRCAADAVLAGGRNEASSSLATQMDACGTFRARAALAPSARRDTTWSRTC